MRFPSSFITSTSAEVSLKYLTRENYQDGKERTKVESGDSDAPQGGKAV